MGTEPALDLAAVVMAGGAGTRFWPLSTAARPKQLLALVGERSLLQQSCDRLVGLVPFERILVVTGEALVPAVRTQLPELPPDNVIGEPARRDTAAAVGLGALVCRARWGNPVIVTVTADHLIEPVEAFQRAVLSAARAARSTGALYTFAIRPTYPATGYGYLELGDREAVDDDTEHYRLLAFHEKPPLDVARTYFESGRFCWNSGMFAWTAGAIIAELERQLPLHLHGLERAVAADRTPAWPEALAGAFLPLKPISVDFGVMEKARDVRCVAAGFSWSDVGGWLAVKELLPADSSGNRLRGRVYTLSSSGSLVYCENPAETVLLAGLDDVVVVRAGSRTLVARADRLEEIKRVVQEMPPEE
jgi:mannose-1-phosphate guanylyltransferase